MPKGSWVKFPYADKAFVYDGPALKKNWERLHRGDCEPFPKSAAVQNAWRLYHAGDFGAAVAAGVAAGLDGYSAANKAAAIYATYLEKSEARKLKILSEAMERGEEAIAGRPKDPNAFYFYALAAGRYSQGISVTKALSLGLGGRVKDALLQTIRLQPKHADAHIAFGSWNAEIVGKVGGMMARLTYGATRDAALEYFQRAIKLNPGSAIARVEYANGLALLFGKERLKDAEKLYAEAAKLKPADAMERLDIESAKE
jgi:tetratricopeptide (TPR) repeat protein